MHSGNDFIFSEREVSMNKREIEQALRDYNWMIKEIKRQRELLGHIETNIVSQSGLESSMPKAQGVTSDPVALEVIRREKKRDRKSTSLNSSHVSSSYAVFCLKKKTITDKKEQNIPATS